MPSTICRDRAHKTPSGLGEVQQGLGVSNSDYEPLSVLQSACRALRLPGGAVLLEESPVNRGPDDLAGGDRHSVELTEARN